MKNFKKRLNIEVDETPQSEEEIQLSAISSLISNNYSQENFRLNNQSPSSSEISLEFNGLNICFLNDVLSYMEQENTDSDVSFKW